MSMTKSGFTAVEVMISLGIASLFLISGYQLFAILSKSHLHTRSRSIAANIAQVHLRKRGNSFSMNDLAAIPHCSPHSLITRVETPDPDQNLNGLMIISRVSAPYGCSEKLIKVEIEVQYLVNGIKQIETQALYVDKT